MPYRPRIVVAITRLGYSHCNACFDPSDGTEYIGANPHAMVEGEVCDRCGAPIPDQPQRTSEYVRYERRSPFVTTDVELGWMVDDSVGVRP